MNNVYKISVLSMHIVNALMYREYVFPIHVDDNVYRKRLNMDMKM